MHMGWLLNGGNGPMPNPPAHRYKVYNPNIDFNARMPPAPADAIKV